VCKQIDCSLAVWPRSVQAGQNVNAVAASPKRGWFTPRVFYFNGNGGRVVRTNASDSCFVDTTGLPPGVYRLWVYVYQGADPGHQNSAEAQFEVTT
jgi:hypothetical protein